MKMFLRYALVVFASLFCFQCFAQTQNWREKYQVKKKDTLYGIAKKYNISVDALIEANPEMKVDGFELKKGSYVCIPYAASGMSGQTSATPVRTLMQTASRQFSGKTVRVGVMLPLHDVDGDGRRMTEFYRGMLMACDSLRAEGMNIDIHAWNVNIDADITNFIKQPGAAKCDIIFGPLYSKQVHALAEFCKARDIQMVIPFSITGDDVSMYKQIFQVYQTNDRQTNNSIETFLKLFPNCHPVFIDCNDKTSTKGNFTFGLRTRLESHNIGYGITNIGSSDDLFVKQFSQNSQNIVILNTGRSPELTLALNKLAILKANNTTLKIKLFGYTEWMMYLGIDEAKFHEFDTYIPSTFYYNPASPRTQSLTRSYRQWFKTDMQNALPRFALTGYDYAQFFLRGFAKYGKAFRGVKNQNSWKAVQAPLRFKQVGAAGMQNDFFQLVHFMPNGNVEAISY